MGLLGICLTTVGYFQGLSRIQEKAAAAKPTLAAVPEGQ